MKIDWKEKASTLTWRPRSSGGAGLNNRAFLYEFIKSIPRYPIERREQHVGLARPPEALMDLMEESRPAAEMLSESYSVEEIATIYGVSCDLMLLKIDEWAFLIPRWFKGWFPEVHSERIQPSF
jgi:hypothetical protein